MVLIVLVPIIYFFGGLFLCVLIFKYLLVTAKLSAKNISAFVAFFENK